MSTPKTPKHTTGEIMRLLMATKAAIAQLVASAPEVMHDAKGRLRCPNCKFQANSRRARLVGDRLVGHGQPG